MEEWIKSFDLILQVLKWTLRILNLKLVTLVVSVAGGAILELGIVSAEIESGVHDRSRVGDSSGIVTQMEGSFGCDS